MKRCVTMKEQITKAMRRIAARRPGRKKLVYDKETQTIVTVDRKGRKKRAMAMPTDAGWI